MPIVMAERVWTKLARFSLQHLKLLTTLEIPVMQESCMDVSFHANPGIIQLIYYSLTTVAICKPKVGLGTDFLFLQTYLCQHD